MGSSFVWKLECPICGELGEASIREPNDHAWIQGYRSMTVQSLSPGFKKDDPDDSEEATFACIKHPDVKANVR
jgi:hypothetical protein